MSARISIDTEYRYKLRLPETCDGSVAIEQENITIYLHGNIRTLRRFAQLLSDGLVKVPSEPAVVVCEGDAE